MSSHYKKLFATALLFMAIPALLSAQDFTGVWKGTIMTTEKFLPYELAISDSSGVLTGYSYTTYTVNSVEMVAVRKIKIKQEGNTLFTDDEGLLFDDFKDKIAKKIRQHNTLVYQMQGKIPTLKGTFVTDKTRDLRSASGEVVLSKSVEFKTTDVAKKLSDMNLLQDMSFVPLDPSLPGISVLKASLVPIAIRTNQLPVIELKKYKPAVYKDLATGVAPQHPTEVARVQQAVSKSEPVKEISEPVATPQKPKQAVVSSMSKAPSATAALAGRTVENIETIYFDSDSLLLTLYDNGEVDGDTVSVIVNGKMIMAKQGLSTHPINKTLFVPSGTDDELKIVMYAENLGSIPPNTGLLIIQDGNVRHEVRFSGDLKKNAGITLKRKF